MVPSLPLLFAILVVILAGGKSVTSFVPLSISRGKIGSPPSRTHRFVFFECEADETGDCNEDLSSSFVVNNRRILIQSIAAPAAASLPYLVAKESASAAAPKAGGECDPGDVLCRQKVYDRYVDSFQEVKDVLPGKPIPAVTNRITYVVQMIIDIGARRDGDAGYIRFGLYGDDCPGSVKQMLFFLTRGITSMDKSKLEDRLEIDYMPVSLGDGNGSVQNICPGRGVEFGVASQSKAYAENKGIRAAGPNFIPQSRPIPTLEGEAFPRPHSCAGLISIPANGIGHSSSSSNSDLDEIYSSAFTITADAVPALDKPKSNDQQRVIGQIIDNESMQLLERLVNLPVQKKLGKSESSGPPLLKVRVRDVDVQKVGK